MKMYKNWVKGRGSVFVGVAWCLWAWFVELWAWLKAEGVALILWACPKTWGKFCVKEAKKIDLKLFKMRSSGRGLKAVGVALPLWACPKI